MNILDIFQGISTLFAQDYKIALFRIFLVTLGILLVYLGSKEILEPLIMIPMGFGMSAVNAGVLFLTGSTTGTIFIDPMVSDTNALMNILQIDFLQPIYTFMFSNGLIACIVFMGIGVITDIGFLLRYPFTSMLIAMFAELGTVATFPIATAMGLNYGEAAAVSLIGGADGPMVLYTSLMLAKDLFVPITIVAYLYLSLTYGGYPYLIRLLIPKHLRAATVKTSKFHNISSKEKLIFAVIANTLLCFLFPVAAPLFLSFFIGIAVRESGLDRYAKLIENGFLYGATFFLGLMLGVLCEASTILNPKILTLLILGMLSLLISGIGGIIGGYIVYFANRKNFNPVIGIAGVSCVPTTAKVAQKEVHKANKYSYVLQYAMGANICGVITTAILTGVYVTLIPLIK
ncbi:MAG: sodium ion-translocating decarboxylase subunit beta [Clostridia bacterium]|jgi:oxaloacetate decarboxylase beta subunit|nr:sodium ion-translocating decarboxylase subunit beta [Clostridia bacterium]